MHGEILGRRRHILRQPVWKIVLPYFPVVLLPSDPFYLLSDWCSFFIIVIVPVEERIMDYDIE